MTEIAWGARLKAEEKARVIALSEECEMDPSFVTAVMAFESGETFSPSVKNPKSSATGVIQFMRGTAEDLGTTVEALAAMTLFEQLWWVRKYFFRYRGRMRTLSDVYMAVLLPSAIGKPESWALFRDDKNKLRDAYDVNAGLDKNRDGVITKAEAAAKVQEKLLKGMRPGNLG